MLFVSLIRSLLDIFGLLIVLPVINLLINPEIINSNKWIHLAYTYFSFQSAAVFTLVLMGCVLVMFMMKVWVYYFCVRYQSFTSFNIAARLSLNRFSSYLGKPYGFHLSANSAVLVRNFATLPFEYAQKLFIPFTQLVNEMLVVLIISSGLLIINPALFLSVALFLVPVVLIYFISQRKKFKRLSEQRDAAGKNLFKSSHQSMSAFREIALMQKRNYFERRFQRSMKIIADIFRQINVFGDMAPRMTELAGITGVFFILLISFLLEKPSAELLQFLILFAVTASRLLPSANRIIQYNNLIRTSEYVFDYLEDIPKEISQEKKEIAAPLSFTKKISLENICFGYEEGKNILNKLNLEVRKGETIGIIGNSGSGKTTLLNLLLRLHNETEGSLSVDGIKITEENLSAWYGLISFVPQNIFVLDGTFLENIAFGAIEKEMDMKRAEEAARRAELLDLIEQSPEKWNTQIGESGLKISGGQRQRLGIARALYTGAPVLIFDEATSALDAQTEELITESIRKLSHHDLTIIIVAHRLNTLKYCDTIYKLENGKLGAAMKYEQVIAE